MFESFTPSDFLMSEAAGRFGKDKESWENRVLWALLNKDNLEDLTAQAKEPILYQSAVKAIRQVNTGQPVGIPVMFDCSASGMQLSSILTGDRNAARICNVIGDSFIDPYPFLHDKMQQRVGTKEVIERDYVKQSIMTSLYGSEAEPEKLFQGDSLRAFYQTMETELPLCWELNQALLEFQKGSDAYSYDWVMPDNFHVHCPVKEVVYSQINCLGTTQVIGQKVQQPHRRNRSLGANLTHGTESFLVRELVRRCNVSDEMYQNVDTLTNRRVSHGGKHSRKNMEMVSILWDLFDKTGFLSSRILQHLDPWTIEEVDKSAIAELLSTIPRKQFPIKTVHDCYAAHPNNALDLLLVFRHLYAELSKSSMLNYLLYCITGVDNNLQIADMSNDILKAKYILT